VALQIKKNIKDKKKKRRSKIIFIRAKIMIS
jgi:hypothetical protein